MSGFKTVNLIFTGFLLTGQDTLDLYTCFELNCTSKSGASTFTGSQMPPSFSSATLVILVVPSLTPDPGSFPSSPFFTALHAVTPELLMGLQANLWHRIRGARNWPASSSSSVVSWILLSLSTDFPCPWVFSHMITMSPNLISLSHSDLFYLTGDMFWYSVVFCWVILFHVVSP